MSQRHLVVAALALLVGGLGLWLAFNLERVPQKVWVGYRGEARNNPWYAAQKLLERMDLRVARAQSVPDLKSLPRDGILLLPRRLASIDGAQQVKLLEWVEAGGHLIVEAEAPAQADPLLDAVGVERRMVEGTPRRERTRDRQKPAPESQAADAPKLASATPPGAARALNLQLGLWRSLGAKEPKLAFTTGAATWLVHLERGAGRVTAITEFNFAGNGSIGSHDHAEFLWHLVRLGPQAGPVTFFYSPTRLSLATWLRENAWAALAAAALLLALWLWRVVPRFGPLAPDPEPDRKRLLDHLRASGRFQWSTGGAVALAEAARDAALRRVMRAQPDFASLGEAEREKRLAEQFGLAPEGVRAVLQPVKQATPQDLVAAASVYQAIHEQLTIARGRR